MYFNIIFWHASLLLYFANLFTGYNIEYKEFL